MKLELHCHSFHSKGTKIRTEAIPSPREIVREAKRKGLDGVALTDHNEVGGWGEARAEARKRGLLFIPGIEMNTLEGHVIGLGISEKIPRGLGAEETMDRIREQGGLAVAPHPFDIRGDGIRELFRKADAAEAFNALNLDRFSNLVSSRRLGSFPAVAGSDAHTLPLVGRCVNVVEARTLEGVLKEIRKGRVDWHGSYATVAEVREWAHQRFLRSREEVIRHVQESYPPFRRWLSLRLLDKFLENKGGFFTLLGYFGIACSFGYGAGKALGGAGLHP